MQSFEPRLIEIVSQEFVVDLVAVLRFNVATSTWEHLDGDYGWQVDTDATVINRYLDGLANAYEIDAEDGRDGSFAHQLWGLACAQARKLCIDDTGRERVIEAARQLLSWDPPPASDNIQRWLDRAN